MAHELMRLIHVLIIAMTMMGLTGIGIIWQTLRAARTNPAEVLKKE